MTYYPVKFAVLASRRYGCRPKNDMSQPDSHADLTSKSARMLIASFLRIAAKSGCC